jgi:hypothetical protein
MANDKYLAIRNWSKFQSTTDRNGKSLEGRRRTYVLDYTEKEADSLYSALTIGQRYMIDACRRLRGRLGHNIQNDPMWIVRQLDIDSKERPVAVKAIARLIKVGFLIPTNEERITVDQTPCNGDQQAVNGGRGLSDISEANGINDITSSKQPTVMSTDKPYSTDRTQDTDRHNSEVSAEHRTQIKTTEPQNLTPGTDDLPSVGEIVEDIIQPPDGLVHLFEQLAIKSNVARKAAGKRLVEIRPEHWKKTWLVDFKRLLASGYSYKQLTMMITYAFGPRWFLFTIRPKNIVDNHDKLAADLKIPVQHVIPEKTYKDKMAEIRERALDAEMTQFTDSVKGTICAGGCGKHLFVEEQGEICNDCILRLHPNAYLSKVRDPETKEMVPVVQYRCCVCNVDGPWNKATDVCYGCRRKKAEEERAASAPDAVAQKSRAASAREFSNLTGSKDVRSEEVDDL